MGRYIGPVCRLCRREGEKLFLKGEKCYTTKCPVSQRRDDNRKVVYVPGQHPIHRRKTSDFGLQLREKQKLRRTYGLREGQFRLLFERASRAKGPKGENLLRLLEMRLDNVVYRLGFGTSRAQARQLVRHGHIEVNGRRVDIPSYQVRVGDVIRVCQRSQGSYFKAVMESTPPHQVPAWLEANLESLWGKVISEPQREHHDLDVKEHLVVEYYSR